MVQTQDERIRIVKIEDDDAECHSCGKVGRPRFLIYFKHLCQHFVALCGPCWKRLGHEMCLSETVR